MNNQQYYTILRQDGAQALVRNIDDESFGDFGLTNLAYTHLPMRSQLTRSNLKIVQRYIEGT